MSTSSPVESKNPPAQDWSYVQSSKRSSSPIKPKVRSSGQSGSTGTSLSKDKIKGKAKGRGTPTKSQPQRGTGSTIKVISVEVSGSNTEITPVKAAKVSELAKPSQERTTPQKKKGPPRKKREYPEPVYNQLRLMKKFKYRYHVQDNGNVVNNSTIYLHTRVAHYHQIEDCFKKAIEKARTMPEIFGKDFECDYQLNFIRKFDGSYLGYAFIDVNNPAFYYALIGYNVDGTERAEYIDDPTWIRPSDAYGSKQVQDSDDDDFYDQPMVWTSDSTTSSNWGNEVDVPKPVAPPKIKRELPPLISLDPLEYTSEQHNFLSNNDAIGNKVDHGIISVSPAFITPGKDEQYDDCSLYVSAVPANDPDFLYTIFARYARSEPPVDRKHMVFPKITIRDSGPGEGNKIFAIVEYAHPYDAGFAKHMLQKIRARYNDQDVVMPVRYAFKLRR